MKGVGSRLAAALLMGVLGGCTNLQLSDPPSEYAPALSNEKGAIVVSLTRTRPGHGRGGYLSEANVIFRRQGTDDRQVLPPLTTDFGGAEAGFGDGKLFVVELPVGSYEFFSWGITQGTFKRYSAKEPMSIPFSVQPGVMKYLGEINVDVLIPDAGPLGMPGISGVRINVKNSQTRDFGVLAKKYPKLTLSDIKIELMRSPPIEY
jgi:hypothetical protein